MRDMPDHTSDDSERIRAALLELIPGVGVPFLVLPTPEDVATKSGANIDDVTAIMATTESALDFLMTPVAIDAERTLSRITISRNPSMADQRAILRRGIEVARRNPNQVRLLLLLLDRLAPAGANIVADNILYSSGLRLIGIDHEEDPDLRRRVTLAWELISIATISHRHGLEDPDADEDIVESLVTACMGILHPPTD